MAFTSSTSHQGARPNHPHPASNPKPSHSVSRSTRPVSHSETKVRRSIRRVASSNQNVSRSIHSVSDSGEKVSHSGNKKSDSSGKFSVASCGLSHFWKNCAGLGQAVRGPVRRSRIHYDASNSLRSHSTKTSTSGTPASRYLAVIDCPRGRPGSSCQASQVWMSALGSATGENLFSGSAETTSFACMNSAQSAGTRKRRKSSSIPELRLSGMSQIPTRGRIESVGASTIVPCPDGSNGTT